MTVNSGNNNNKDNNNNNDKNSGTIDAIIIDIGDQLNCNIHKNWRDLICESLDEQYSALKKRHHT